RYVLRRPPGATAMMTYRPRAGESQVTVTLTAEAETTSFDYGEPPPTDLELPVETRLLESGFAYVRLTDFLDNQALTVQLWERLMATLNRESIPGLVIDLRRNAGGSGFLADQLAAYFFDEPLELGRTGRYNPALGAFVVDPREVDRFYLPEPELRYRGPVAVVVGPDCASACEFFAYAMTLQDRAAIIGHYPTAGVGGSIGLVRMPAGQLFQFTNGRAVNMEGEIHLEGKGVAPTVRAPVNEETLFAEHDVLLAAAVETLQSRSDAPTGP
ncbi:MAG TPA: S41 family peptidase, partial [Caldilineaceae bacterium]|nr:S41 family peptidase [Caldilineaceae bacterium]